jgi:ketosteroid isomerase-like protein
VCSSDLWLHGVPRDTYVRAPLSSEGCVTMANADLIWLKPYVERTGAPVVLSDKVDWIPQSQAREARDEFLARIEEWRQKWMSLDLEGFLDFYDDDFVTAGMNKAQYTEHRRKVDAGKTFVSVKIRDLSLFRYPGENLLLAEFSVDYESDQYQFKDRRQQYWRQDAKGRWKILREENL